MRNATNESPHRTAKPTDAHEHGWNTESRHLTSAGYIIYVRCGACGARRVDFEGDACLLPSPLSNATASPRLESAPHWPGFTQ